MGELYGIRPCSPIRSLRQKWGARSGDLQATSFAGQMICMKDSNDSPDPEDTNAFREAMNGVQRRVDDQVEPFRRKHRPEPLRHLQAENPEESLGDLSVDTPEFFEFRRPGIQHRVFQDLQRGLMPPEDVIDLHGMRVIEARPAFARFMQAAQRHQKRVVHIIHGKGRGSEGQQPILKQKTYQWLLQTEAVLAFVTAPRWDGGSGATYVLLSRKFGST